MVSPAPIKGSGGVRTILTYADALRSRGHDVTVSFLPDGKALGGDLSALVERYYGISGLRAGVFPFGLDTADLAIATRWDTPAAIRRQFTGRLVHLIQDIEAWFNPVGDAYLTAENNFLFDSTFVTLGHWLAKKQQLDYQAPSFTMDFGFDNQTYGLKTAYEDRPKRICFIYQPEKPRRCARIGIEALGIVKHFHPDCEIAFYGNDTPARLWYPVVNLGILPPHGLNDLYNSCVVGLCISSSNPSRIPFEMMGCGLPVVDVYRSNNLHDYSDKDGVLLAHQTPESLAKAMMAILEDPALANRLSKGGLQFSIDRSLEIETSQFVAYVERVHSGAAPDIRTDAMPRYRRAPIIADAYDLSRARAFCDRQGREFLSLSVEEGVGSTHKVAGGATEDPCNIIPVSKMIRALQTSTSPGIDWDQVSFPEERSIQTHPVTGTPITAVLHKAVPVGVRELRAVVKIAHASASPMEFAFALVPALDGEDTLAAPDDDVWVSPNASSWNVVHPVDDVEISAVLPEPTKEVMDLHLAVRVPDGSVDAFSWCRWLLFRYLTTTVAKETDDAAPHR